ncbi:hypothetical protein Vafri_677 [Volvox africanus]|nr:hypothetical protein Vafri_677 [Volvox africanus]
MHGFNQLATFKQRAKAEVWRRAEHPGPAEVEPALPAAPQEQQEQQHPERFISKDLLPRTLQTQIGHDGSNDAQKLHRNVDAPARSLVAAPKLKAIVSIQKPFVEAPLRFADPLAASIRNRTLTAALSIFKNRKSSRVLRLSDVPNLPAPVQPTGGQRCSGDRGLKTALQGGYNAHGRSPQPLGAGARPEAVDPGFVQAPYSSSALGQQQCQRQPQRSLLAAVPPGKAEALTRSTAPDAYRPTSNTRGNSDGSHRAWSRSGLPPQRPLTAGQADDGRQPLGAADAAGEKVADDDAVRVASVTAVPLAAADAPLAPVLGFGDDLDIRDCMQLVRSRVASMVEADLGVRLRAPEQPATVRQASRRPTVGTPGTGGIAREWSAAETSRVPTEHGSAHAAPGQDKHAQRGQWQSTALADQDTVEGATCVQGVAGGAARHNGQPWTSKHARASRGVAGCELDTDLLIRRSPQQNAEGQGIQREQIPSGGRGGPPGHRDSSGALGPMTAPSRGCEQGWVQSQTAKTSDKRNHEQTGNKVPGLSASFLGMDDEQPDHPALRKRARGDRDAAATGIRRGPWGWPAEDAHGHNAHLQRSAAAEDTSVGPAASMRSTSASTDECNDEFPGDYGEARQWRSTGRPRPPNRGAPCSGPRALPSHKHFGGTGDAGGGAVPPFYPDTVGQTSRGERHPPQPGRHQQWKLSAGILPHSSGGAEPSGSQYGGQRHHYSRHNLRAAAVIATDDIAISESPAKVALGSSKCDNLWLRSCDEEDGIDMQHDDRLQVPLLKRQRRQGVELHSSPDAHGGWHVSAVERGGLTRERRAGPVMCSPLTEQMYWEGGVHYDGELKEGLREAAGTADAVPPGLHQWLVGVGDEQPHVSFGNAEDWPPHDFEDYQRDELRMRQQLHGGWDVDGASLAGGGRDTRGSDAAAVLRATDLARGGGASARVPSRLRCLNEGHEEQLVGFGAFTAAGSSPGNGQDGNAYALTHFNWQQVGRGGGIGVAGDQLEEADVGFEENVEELFQLPGQQIMLRQLQGHRYRQQTQEHKQQRGLNLEHRLDAGTNWFDGGEGSDLVGDAWSMASRTDWKEGIRGKGAADTGAGQQRHSLK